MENLERRVHVRLHGHIASLQMECEQLDQGVGHNVPHQHHLPFAGHQQTPFHMHDLINKHDTRQP
jgi:hypothetical protein